MILLICMSLIRWSFDLTVSSQSLFINDPYDPSFLTLIRDPLFSRSVVNLYFEMIHMILLLFITLIRWSFDSTVSSRSLFRNDHMILLIFRTLIRWSFDITVSSQFLFRNDPYDPSSFYDSDLLVL